MLKYWHFIREIWTDKRDDSETTQKTKLDHGSQMANAWIYTIFLIINKYSATTIDYIKYGFVQESGLV